MDILQCKDCGKDIYNYEDVCTNCGLVINTHEYSDICWSEPILKKSSSGSCTNLAKMQLWYTYTNDEKNTYKLNKYIEELCIKLYVSTNLIPSIKDIANIIMNIIKKHDGTKRARVKDGIIIFCIHYVSKNTATPYSTIELAKKLDIDIKYVTKAERMILELLSSNKLSLNKNTVLQPINSLEYIKQIIIKNNLKINIETINLVEQVINICNENDILLDYAPLSLGVCCLYYVLLKQNINMNMKMIASLCDISTITVNKAYNDFIEYKSFIESKLN